MPRAVRVSARFGLFCLALFVVFQGQSLRGQGGGGAGGGAKQGDITAVNTPAGGGLAGGVTSGDANLTLLTSCSSGQLLQWNGSAWVCATASGTGTVTSLSQGIGITLSSNPITTTGSIAIDTNVVLRLGIANAFTANQSITGNLTITGGNIALPATTSSSIGVLTLGGALSSTASEAPIARLWGDMPGISQ